MTKLASPLVQLAVACALTAQISGTLAAEGCTAQSGPLRTPVIELYTSEGCSSCPPADKWLSTLKGASADNGAVVQAFHVGYWDYIGWVDRFASPSHTTRQRKIAAINRQDSIYTPQAVLNGRDWRNWGKLPTGREPAGASISLKQVAADQFEAMVTPAPGAAGSWSAYWSVTEHGHSSKVKSGENAGEFLQHDFVVRQYTPIGNYPMNANAPQKLTWRSIGTTAGHARQINLVVFDPITGNNLQAVSASC